MIGKLQFLHKSKPFNDRESAYEYIDKLCNHINTNGKMLMGEPIVVSYYDKGNVEKLEIILAITSLDKYHIIDTCSIETTITTNKDALLLIINELKNDILEKINSINNSTEDISKKIDDEISERKESDEVILNKIGEITKIINENEEKSVNSDKEIKEDIKTITSEISTIKVNVEDVQSAADTLSERVSTAESDINKLQDSLTIGGATANAIAAAQRSADEAHTAANEAQKDVDELKNKVDDLSLTHESEVDALHLSIDNIDNRIDSLGTTKKSVNGNFVNVEVTQNQGLITNVVIEENNIASQEQVTSIQNTLDIFLNDAKLSGDVIDTLKEIQDYINSDASAAAEMTTNIKAAKDAADAAQKDVDALEKVVDNVINSIDNEITSRKDEDKRIREEYNSSLISTKSEIKSAYELSDKALKEELGGEITSTNTRVTAIESDYLTSLDKSELISSNKVTSDRISEVEKNYLLADTELNKRLEVVEGGYALKSDVNTEVERAKGEEKRIETLVNSKLESSTFNEKVIEIDNKITNLTKKDESIETEILNVKENYTLKTSLNSEIARAEGAENKLLLKINGESERAASKENAIETLITNEVSRAKAKENELNESIKEVKTLVGDNTVLSQINDVVNTLDFTDVAQNEMFVSEVQQENGKIAKIGRLPFSGVTYIKDIRDEVDDLKNDITEKAPISSVYTKDETNSTFVNKSQIVNVLGGSENLIVSQKKINEEIDKLRSEIINGGTGGEVDLTTIYERLQKIESDIANINEKIGSGTIITTDNITEYIVTPTDDENIVISKTENGGISIKLVKIDNMNF